MYLELAEEPYQFYEDYYDQDYLGAEDSPYVFIPGQFGEEGVYMREDYFDDLPEEEWDQLMVFLHASQQGMSGLFKNFFTKMRNRKQARKARKQTRKLETIAVRGKAGTGIAGAFKGIGSALGGIFGGRDQGTLEPGFQLPQIGGSSLPTQKPMNWTPWIIGGISLVVVGGALYANRNK